MFLALLLVVGITNGGSGSVTNISAPVSSTATPAPTTTPQPTSTPIPTATPGPFTTFTKTGLTTDGSNVNLISVSLAADQAATINISCCFQLIHNTGTHRISAGCDKADAVAWRIGATTTVALGDFAYPLPASGSSGFYTLAYASDGIANIQYNLTATGGSSTFESSSMTCEIATHGQSGAFTIL